MKADSKSAGGWIGLIIHGPFRAMFGIWRLLGPRRGLKLWLLQIGALALIAGIGGFLFAASGIPSIKASSGHWPITEWFLSFSMSRSVSTHSAGIDVPPLDTPGLVMRGAAYYETGCFPCHGNPSIQQPRIARAMTPHPPYLPRVIHEWEPEELFYIVKHGVKFTGMPAWPARNRDDEVWSMVAFLLKFPQLSPDEYRRLAGGGESQDKEDAPLQALTGPDAVPGAIISS